MGLIDTKKIPKSEGNMLGSVLLTAITNYFADPKHQQEYEEWLKKRNEENKGSTSLTT